MSEYQYYEFHAVDKPLDERAMAALRAISSRAEITPTSLVNVYHFGDFKGSPNKLLEARDVRADENRRRVAEQKAEEQARRAREEAVARARYLESRR